MREAHFFEVVRGLCLWRGRSHVRTTENSRRDHLKLWLATKISKSQGCFGEWMCFRITSGCHSEWIRLVSGQFQRIRNVSGSEMDKTILVVPVQRHANTYLLVAPTSVWHRHHTSALTCATNFFTAAPNLLKNGSVCIHPNFNVFSKSNFI